MEPDSTPSGILLPFTKKETSDDDVRAKLKERVEVAAEIAHDALIAASNRVPSTEAIATFAAAILAQWPLVERELSRAE